MTIDDVLMDLAKISCLESKPYRAIVSMVDIQKAKQALLKIIKEAKPYKDINKICPQPYSVAYETIIPKVMGFNEGVKEYGKKLEELFK